MRPYGSGGGGGGAGGRDGCKEFCIKADAETCEGRDPKGLYKRARAGEIAEFTGIAAPSEDPAEPELVVDTAHETIDQSLHELLDYVERKIAVTGDLTTVRSPDRAVRFRIGIAKAISRAP